jgi:predicted metal-dependent phosphoesterase TrpH
MNNRADLHTHTTASDGMFRPAENVRLAKEAGLAAIGITDHDTVAGISEALESGQTYEILVVPGVEISTAISGKDIHILGYGFLPEDPIFLERLLSLRNVRNSRNDQILENLGILGMNVTRDELESVAGKSRSGDGSVGRPHIAQALVDKGYVSTVREAFDLYLGEGKPAFTSPPRIKPIDAIRWIHEAGGVAIVAHPGLYTDDPLVLSLLDAGADGLEAFHSDHDPQSEKKYEAWASSRGKLVTGGSDFHGVKEGVSFHGYIGNRSVDSAIVRSLTRRSG